MHLPLLDRNPFSASQTSCLTKSLGRILLNTDADSLGLAHSLGICISHQLPWDAMARGPPLSREAWALEYHGCGFANTLPNYVI